jgi:hypothetical protein
MRSVGLFLSSKEGGLRGPKAYLKLTVLPSCLRIMVLGCPPLLEEILGVVTIVRVRGVQQRV